MAEECIVGFPDGATFGQAGLLKAGNVDVLFGEFPVSDLPCVVNLLKVICEFRTHGPDVAACKRKSWGFLFTF